MGWTVKATGRKMIPMNGVDLGRCLEAAHAVDPFRGWKWFDRFVLRARQLGYRESTAVKCKCQSDVCNPECGLGKLV